ncbi:MAG: zeta toxin family protein [Methylococcales bacterium]|nr:zeta toxin family protein [Methylococcales bacterium]
MTPLPHYPRIQHLRTTLAIVRAMQLLPVLQQEAAATISHDQTKRITYLNLLYNRIHGALFHDWHAQATADHRPGLMPDAGKRKRFRNAIARLVMDDDNSHQDSALFDHNGFVIRCINLDQRLAQFYQNARSIRPFGYGNRITLDLFLIALSQLPAMRAVYEHGLDFRRLSDQDALALHDLGSSSASLVTAFAHALDPKRTPCLNNHADGYGTWPEHKRQVFGIPFLTHSTEQGRACLVCINGGLVPVETVANQPFISGQLFADYPFLPASAMIGYLPGTETLRQRREIDGIYLPADGSAPLLCLDVNILTGLRSPSHGELLNLIRQLKGPKANIFALLEDAALPMRLKNLTEADSRLSRAIDLAVERLQRMQYKIDAALSVLFADTTPVDQPWLLMSMGGAGSGKSVVEQSAHRLCGANFVTASLDEFRKLSDFYQLLTAAEHHSDDYVFVEPFANRLRDEVAKRALAQRIHLLYDGTGIPYWPRYGNLIEHFHQAGFRTQIIAVDAFLVLPDAAGSDAPHVIERVKSRFQQTGRALPWVVTVYKHILAGQAFLAALEHPALDKLVLYANDGAKDQHYPVAASAELDDEAIRALQRHQLNGSLAEQLAQYQAEHALEASELSEAQTGYLIYPGSRHNRALLIYHNQRLIWFLEKGQLNPHASGPEGLTYKTDSLAFHVTSDSGPDCYEAL